MTRFERFELKNGLRVILHQDLNTPMAVVNVLYNVGAKDEHPDKTGFAHLFEHLMFGGSANVPVFDTPLEMAGGNNNAFTNNDFTNYYEILPAANLETALWLESDRMMQLNINDHSLDVQKKVVVEEFKENYLNQPYGDVWHILRSLAYKLHPYQWPTIGLKTEHIDHANLEDVKAFYKKYYRPSNAILVVAGNFQIDDTIDRVEKWFGNISDSKDLKKHKHTEPKQTAPRNSEIYADVPVNAIYKAWHMCDRLNPEYVSIDLASDVLANGKSSRLFQNLVKKQKLFTELDAYITGSIDEGLFVVAGKLEEGISLTDADKAIENEIRWITEDLVLPKELQKIKNKIESAYEFGEISLMTRAFNLAYFEMLGDANLANQEMNKYLAVTPEQIQLVCKKYLVPANCSTLYYFAKNN